MKDIQSFLFDVKNNSSVGGFMNSGIERRTTDTAFETGFLDAVENILTVEYFTHRTMREHVDYVVGYRYGRLSLDTPEPSWICAVCETSQTGEKYNFRINGQPQKVCNACWSKLAKKLIADTKETLRKIDEKHKQQAEPTPEPSEPEPQPAARRKTNIGRKSGNARNFPTEIPPESPQDDTERKELETLII